MHLRKRHIVLAAAFSLAAFAAPASAQQNPTVRAEDRAPCRDPWVNIAIRELRGRAPSGQHESGECNVRLYNGASWGSYAELKGYVSAVLRTLEQYDARFTSQGTFYFDDDYNQFNVPLSDVRVATSRGVVDGNGRGTGDDGSGFGGSIGLPNGVTLRFRR